MTLFSLSGVSDRSEVLYCQQLIDPVNGRLELILLIGRLRQRAKIEVLKFSP
jgi:hypothetical protein